MGIVFMFPSSPQTNSANMNYTVVVDGGVMILALIYYYFPKYGGVHWFTGPVPTIGRGDDAREESVESKSLKEDLGATQVVEV